MKTRAAVAWEAGKPLEIVEIDLEGPKEGEVLLRNIASGVCHTDAFTLSGEDPEGIFPVVLGHEGGAIVEEVGADVERQDAPLPVGIFDDSRSPASLHREGTAVGQHVVFVARTTHNAKCLVGVKFSEIVGFE